MLIQKFENKFLRLHIKFIHFLYFLQFFQYTKKKSYNDCEKTIELKKKNLCSVGNKKTQKNAWQTCNQ